MYAFLAPVAFGWALFLYCVLGYYRPRRYRMWIIISLLFLFSVSFGLWGFYFLLAFLLGRNLLEYVCDKN